MAISDMSFAERAALFANLSAIAYSDEADAKKQVKKLGFTQVEFYNNHGAQAYRFQNKDDMVIACRGTQPTEFNDIKADLNAIPVVAETVSRVHKGFKAEVDELWPMILEDLDPKAIGKRKLWVTGHSLGAAMATIVASRCSLEQSYEAKVEELHTFGSPRVGWRKYCKSLSVTHYRWRNNNDIVTTVPPAFMGYKHDGELCYIDSAGDVRIGMPWIKRAGDKLKCMVKGIFSLRIDNFADHSIMEYAKHLNKWSKQ